MYKLTNYPKNPTTLGTVTILQSKDEISVQPGYFLMIFRGGKPLYWNNESKAYLKKIEIKTSDQFKELCYLLTAISGLEIEKFKIESMTFSCYLK